MDGNGQPHAVTINLAYCEANEIDGARERWGRVLAFDALIGNTDRHSENWGFLVDEHGGRRMAPMFDNGTSLAYLIGEGSLEATMQEAKLSRFIIVVGIAVTGPRKMLRRSTTSACANNTAFGIRR